MPSYIIPGEKVQFFEPPHDEPQDSGVVEEHEEQLQEYVDPGDHERVHLDDVQEHIVSQPEVSERSIPKKKNNDWIFFIILLLIAVGASIFFRN
jgi:hypothetical protein